MLRNIVLYFKGGLTVSKFLFAFASQWWSISFFVICIKDRQASVILRAQQPTKWKASVAAKIYLLHVYIHHLQFEARAIWIIELDFLFFQHSTVIVLLWVRICKKWTHSNLKENVCPHFQNQIISFVNLFVICNCT